jgi:hypothetical protein
MVLSLYASVTRFHNALGIKMRDNRSLPPACIENIVAVLIFLALLGFLILSAGNSTPFAYGRF